MVALREPSLHRFRCKKAGRKQAADTRLVVPMEDINLHFTGDFHAIGPANLTCWQL